MNILEELGIEIKGTAQMINGIKDVLEGIISEPTLDDEARERLYTATRAFFSKMLTEMLRYKCFVLWSEPDTVTVHILESPEECDSWIESAEDLFSKYPIESGENREMDEFKHKNRFVCRIGFEQFLELAGDEFDNPNNFSISECGFEYFFEDRSSVVKARAEGRI